MTLGDVSTPEPAKVRELFEPARAFVQKVGPDALALSQRAVIACIGPSTATACRAIGLVPHVVAEVSTEEGLVEALIAHMEVRR